MADSGDHDAFVLHMIGAQSRIYAYILSLVLDRDRARDILQQANLVMLQKESEFAVDTNFLAWAYRIAFYEVLADRRSRVRDRHLFSEELLAVVASGAARENETFDERSQALDQCLQSLSQENRELVMARYRPGGQVSDLAQRLCKSPAAVSALLYRIRAGLLECVENKLGALAAK